MSTSPSCTGAQGRNRSFLFTSRRLAVRLLAANLLGLAAAAVAQVPPPCLTPPPHLVGWWTLDETGPFLYDRALGDTGTPSNTTSFPGFVNRSLFFNGATSSVTIPDTPAINFGTGDFSIDLWLRTGVVSTTVRVILDKRDAAVGYHLFLYNGRLGLQLADGSGVTNYVSNLFVANNAWTHVAVTVARGSHQGILFYKNGAPGSLTGDPTLHPGSLTNAAPLLLGVRSPAQGGGGTWRGFLDEVELFNRVLQPAEVKALFAAGASGKCKCASMKIVPRAWWGFNETSGTVALDSGVDAQGPFTGTIAGATRVQPGWVGAGHLMFNGNSDAVTVANSGPLALQFLPSAIGALSIDAWINTTAPSGPIVTDLTTDPLDRGLNGYSLSYANGQLAFEVTAIDANFTQSSLTVSCSTCAVVNDGNWHLVGVTLSWGPGGNAAFATLFIDGVPVAPLSSSLPVNLVGTAGGQFVIGAQLVHTRGGQPSFFTGSLDEVEVFDRALTQADYLSIFSAGRDGKCPLCTP